LAIRFMPGRLEGLEGLQWNKVFARERVPVLNDAHAALLGEIWQGAATGMDDVAMLTLGTGVGGAAVSDGRLLRGILGRAGHLGHMTVDFEGAPDICGTPGSLEDAIGNASLSERAGDRFANTHELVAAYAEGDAEAKQVWGRSLRALAASIVSIINVLDPRAVILGGGIAEAGEHLFAPLESLVREREWQPAGARVDLLPAQLGPWAGTYGALYNALNES
jgi:glucokinase